MVKTDKRKTFRWQAYKPLLATALAATGIFNMANAVFAAGTAADTDISNTATATYEDGSGGPPINVESNTVVIKVAEVAGLTAIPRPIEDSTPGTPLEPGDTVTFGFDVANVGNADTGVYVPDLVPENFTPTGPVEVYRRNLDGSLGTLIGTVLGGGQIVQDGGGVPAVFAPDEIFVVQVVGTPDPLATDGDTVGVTLGDTSDNANEGPSPFTQNQADVSDGGPLPTDLRTVDADPTQSPSNGEREAEAVAATTLDAAPLALAKILKTSGTPNLNVPSNPTDDLIPYSLSLEVDNVDPSGNFQPADLVGTSITVDGVAATHILISDAIPLETRLAFVDNVPAGWTPVFAIGAGDAAAASDPLTVDWQTAVPADLNTVNRIGFIFTGTIAQGTPPTTGFDFTVVTSGVVSTTGTTIENLAQVFGQTFNDPTNQIIYDESGDDNANNFDGNTPPTPDGSAYTPGTDDGIAPESDGNGDNAPDNPGDVDGGNNNTGTGPDGETNVVPLIPATDDIVTGPDGASAATGPSGTTEDDFTNKSTPIPAGLAPTDTLDPAPVVFDNSLTNPAAAFIANVVVEPLSPADAAAASGQPVTAYEGATPIPDGTTVTITDSTGTNSAVYTFTGGVFTTTDTPVSFGNVDPAQVVDYTVEVDLPAGTAQLAEVSIPLVAFPDTDAAGFDIETVSNITIDRLYTGFMSLVKESQILDAGGGIAEAFTQTPAREAAPGETIEYRITYENISSAPGASTGSITLDATNFTILEDGNAGTNNWAQFTTHVAGSATASAGDIGFAALSADPTSATEPVAPDNVEKYDNVVLSVAPGVTGTFEFDRTVD